jgi:hypothetical protein
MQKKVGQEVGMGVYNDIFLSLVLFFFTILTAVFPPDNAVWVSSNSRRKH